MPTEFEALVYAAKKEKYKRSFYTFFKDAAQQLEPSTDWSWNFHHQHLCDILQSEALRIYNKQPKITDWIINVPFRSSKSLIVSITYNAWIWAFFPECKLMTISYAEGLAIKQAYLTKILLNSSWYKNYFPNVSLMKDDNQKGSYTNMVGGTRQSFGMTGQITGSGADIIICDDPNKVNDSKKVLETANLTFDEVVFNRLNNPETGVRIVVQQRVNANDLSGHLLKNEGWEHVNIPATLTKHVKPIYLAEKYQDGLFWSKRFSHKILNQYRIALGSRGYNSQLLMQTSSDGGNIFKEQWFETIEYDEKKHSNLSWDMIVDPSYTSKQTNDPTGILICAKFGNDIIIKKAYAVRKEFPELIKEIQQVANHFKIRRIFIEPKASGLSIIQQLRRSTRLNVVELPNNRDDKETRANAASPSVEAKRVKLLDGSYISNFIDEVTNFPLAAHDDMTDCLIYAIEKFVNKKAFNYKI